METTRINLEVPVAYRERLKALQTKMEVTTGAEVFRKAIALMEIFVDAKIKGSKVKVEHQDGTTETLLII